MSMNEVIDRFAAGAAKNPRNNVLELYSFPHDYGVLDEKDIESLNKTIVKAHRLAPPKLSISEIDSALSDYPYKLPMEFYELYQRGNGFLPIGLGDKDWNCYYNYFVFPSGSDIHWHQLHESMEYYRYFRQGVIDYSYKIEPNIFPLMTFERWVWAIAGNEVQKETSPVFHFHGDDISHDSFMMTVEWSSLTEMIADHCSKPDR